MIRFFTLALLTLLLTCANAFTGHATVPIPPHIVAPPREAAIPVAITMPRPAEIYTPDTTSAAPHTQLTATATPTTTRKARFLPMSRRIDREISRIRYVHKGEVMMGLTASYGTLESDDSDLWLVIDNINLGASIFTINPFVGYFFRDNMCVGGRFGYSEIAGNLGSAALSLDDINFAVNDIVLKTKNYSFGLFLRSYAGLDPKGHFGLFGELELSMSSGTSVFSYYSAGELHETFGDNTKIKLSFNPGMAVYIFPNVCTTISFGLGGFQYVKTTQKDAQGNVTGKRSYSNMRFRLNLAEIRIGMTIHLWNKKKALLK